jgi:hypothetical protein
VKQLLAQILSSRKVWRVSLVSAFVTGCALGLWMLGGTTLLLLVIFSGAGLYRLCRQGLWKARVHPNQTLAALDRRYQAICGGASHSGVP